MTTVLLLHGIASSATTWWRAQRDLTDLGVAVIAPSLPGHGGRSALPAPSIAAHADAVLADLGEQPVDLVVGHSLGAVVGLALAAQAPGLVERVLMEDPPSLASRSPRDVAGDLAAEAAGARRDPAAFEAALLAENPVWSPLDARAATESRQVIDVAAAEALLDAGRWDLLALVGACPAPVHLLAATPPGSALTDPDRTELLDLLEDRALVVESGHGVHRDRPALWLHAVLAALNAAD